MLEALDGKTCFITGASGFLGTALVCRLILSSDVNHIYALCRGGTDRLFRVWDQTLPAHLATQLRTCGRITVFDGDIEKPLLGLNEKQIMILKQGVQHIIHSASSINLKASLPKLVPCIIEATLTIAEMAQSFPLLERFVYISTAFANSHLHDATGILKAEAREVVHPMRDGLLDLESATDELDQVRKYGAIAEDHTRYFPFSYGYAKHLTERLLIGMFESSPDNLLIIRPSIIGPAAQFPFPGYEIPGSAPLTMLGAAILLEPWLRVKASSPFADPSTQSHHDEVPVDVVVDRLVLHLAHGTQGIVHAVSGNDNRFSSGEIYTAVLKERRLFWKPKLSWRNVDWHASDLHMIARIYVVLGTSYVFREDRTDELVARLTDSEMAGLMLYSNNTGLDMSGRRAALRENVRAILCKKGWPAWIVGVVCRR